MAGFVGGNNNSKLIIGKPGQDLQASGLVLNIVTYGGRSTTTSEQDVTTISSPGKEFKPGVPDHGSMAYTCNLVSGEFYMFKNLGDKREIIQWGRFVYDDDGALVYSETGEGYISEYGMPDITVDGLVQVNFTIRISGATSTDVVDPTAGDTSAKPTSVVVSGVNGVKTITTPGGRLTLYANVKPVGLPDPTYTWSLKAGSEEFAELSPLGVMLAKKNGTATAVATSNADPSISGELEITITGQGTDLM